MRVITLGNPTPGESIDVDIQGIQRGSLQLQVTNSAGQLVTSQIIENPNHSQRIKISLGKSTGMYLLQVSTPTQQKVVKVIKQ